MGNYFKGSERGMRKYSVSFLIILLCISLFMTFPCKADIVWSDNFNDGNYNGWIMGAGIFSAEDNTLKTVSGDSLYTLYHLSSVTAGTWSFDVLVGEESDVYLMYNPEGQRQGLIILLYGTHIIPYSDSSFNPPQTNRLGEYILSHSMTGWQHIDVTRDSDGRTCLYNNGTLLIDAMDHSIITSELFEYLSYGEGAIDNIVVTNTVDIVPPPSVPFYIQTWFLATVGVIAVATAVIIVAFLRRKK